MTGTSPDRPAPQPAACADEVWYRGLARELTCVGLHPYEVESALASTRADADSARLAPGDLFGPAVLYARRLASALRESGAGPLDREHPVFGQVVLRLSGVSARRGRRTILRDLDLTVHRGEIVAVVGANGAGKSTLVGVSAGVLRASAGTVERTAHFGYAPQLDALGPLLTVDEHLRLFGASQGSGARRSVSTGHRILRRLGWAPHGNQVTGTLSGGTQQKLNLTLAQMGSPDLLLLDEPYQGLDAAAYEDLWSLISSWRESGAGVLLVTHLLRDIEFVDRVIELPAPDTSQEHAA